MGWGVLTVWECEVSDRDLLRDRLEGFLGATGASCRERVPRVTTGDADP